MLVMDRDAAMLCVALAMLCTYVYIGPPFTYRQFRRWLRKWGGDAPE